NAQDEADSQEEEDRLASLEKYSGREAPCPVESASGLGDRCRPRWSTVARSPDSGPLWSFSALVAPLLFSVGHFRRQKRMPSLERSKFVPSHPWKDAGN